MILQIGLVLTALLIFLKRDRKRFKGAGTQTHFRGVERGSQTDLEVCDSEESMEVVKCYFGYASSDDSWVGSISRLEFGNE